MLKYFDNIATKDEVKDLIFDNNIKICSLIDNMRIEINNNLLTLIQALDREIKKIKGV